MKKLLYTFGASILALPHVTFAAMQCRVNGQMTECPAFIQAIEPFWGLINFLIITTIALTFVSLWIIFRKAGKHGWAVLVPIYNIFVLVKIVNRPSWWLILMFIPFVSFVVGVILLNDLAKSFGKGSGYTVGLLFLGFIFAPILAFGKSQYVIPVRVNN